MPKSEKRANYGNPAFCYTDVLDSPIESVSLKRGRLFTNTLRTYIKYDCCKSGQLLYVHFGLLISFN